MYVSKKNVNVNVNICKGLQLNFPFSNAATL